MADCGRGRYLPSGSGAILSLIASGRAPSRSLLAEASGLSRSTVAERLAALLAAGFVEESAEALPSGGRPARLLRLNRNFGVALVANIGESHVHLAVADLKPRLIAETVVSLDVRSGPETILGWICKESGALLEKVGRSKREV